MTSSGEPPVKGIKHRFQDLSAGVPEERLVRYVIHQIDSGRHIEDIVKDPYIVEHFDEDARERVLEHAEVIKALEQLIRRQFAGYGDSVGSPQTSPTEQDSAGQANDGKLSDL